MTKPLQRLLDAAAAYSLQRIRRDQRKAKGPMRPVLGYIGDHLFDSGLGIPRLTSRFKVHESRLNVMFNAAVRTPPGTYIEVRRMQSAKVLLTESELTVWKITEMIGYSWESTFRRAFGRNYGKTPAAYRRAQRRKGRPEVWTLGRFARSAGLTHAQMLQRFGRGDLEPELAKVLLDRLRDLYREAG